MFYRITEIRIIKVANLVATGMRQFRDGGHFLLGRGVKVTVVNHINERVDRLSQQ